MRAQVVHQTGASTAAETPSRVTPQRPSTEIEEARRSLREAQAEMERAKLALDLLGDRREGVASEEDGAKREEEWLQAKTALTEAVRGWRAAQEELDRFFANGS